MKNFIKNNQIWLIPLPITLVLALPMFIWLALDHSLADRETGQHLWTSLKYGRLWYDYIAGRESFGHLLTNYYYSPPLAYQPAILFYLLFGSGAKILSLSNLVWLFIANFSLYQYSRLIWGKRTGLAAVLIFMSMPIIISSATGFSLLLPLISWSVLSLYLSLLFLKKPRLKTSLWLGIVLGLGLLIEWTFLLILVPLVAWLAYRLIYENKLALKASARYLIAIIIAAAVIALPWYIVNHAALLGEFWSGELFSGTFIKNLLSLYNDYLLLPLLVIFLVSLYLSYTNKKLREKNSILFGLLALAYILISIFSANVTTISMIIPIIALLVASVMAVAKSPRVFTAILLIIFILNHLSVLFGLTNGRDLNVAGLKILAGGQKPSAELCNIQEVVSTIPYGASAQLIGESDGEISDWMAGYYLERSGRVWLGHGGDAGLSDYWILHLDRSLKSRQTLFEFQDRAWVLNNFDCTDRSIVIVMKNAERASTHLPTY